MELRKAYLRRCECKALRCRRSWRFNHTNIKSQPIYVECSRCADHDALWNTCNWVRSQRRYEHFRNVLHFQLRRRRKSRASGWPPGVFRRHSRPHTPELLHQLVHLAGIDGWSHIHLGRTITSSPSVHMKRYELKAPQSHARFLLTATMQRTETM